MMFFALSPDKEEALRIENEQNQKLYRQLGIEPTKQDDGVSRVVEQGFWKFSLVIFVFCWCL
jgi:hypothetical protein